MVGLIFPQRWRSKPQRPVALDLSHPLARGLVFYAIDIGGNYFSLLRDDRGTKIGTVPLGMGADDRVGAGVLWGGSGSAYFSQTAHPEVKLHNTGGSFACGIVKTGTVGNYTRSFGRTARNGAAGPYFNYDFEINPGGAGQGVLTANALAQNGVRSVTATAIFDNVYQTLVGAATRDDYFRVYVDGVSIGQATFNYFNETDTDADLILSGSSNASAANAFVGLIPWGAVWNRALSADEAMALHREPYALLRPIPARRLYYVAAGGTDVTALPGAGAVSAQGHAPTAAATKNVTAAPTAGAVSVQGFAPTASVAGNITAEPTTGTVAVQGLAPAPSTGAVASPGVGTVSAAGLAPTASAGVTASPGAGSVAAQGYEPTASASVVASPAAGAIAVQGYAPSASAGIVAVPGAGSVATEGFAPSVVVSVLASPGAGAAAIEGFAPTAEATSAGSVVALPGLGSIYVEGFAPIPSAGVTATPGVGGISVRGFVPNELLAMVSRNSAMLSMGRMMHR